MVNAVIDHNCDICALLAWQGTHRPRCTTGDRMHHASFILPKLCSLLRPSTERTLLSSLRTVAIRSNKQDAEIDHVSMETVNALSRPHYATTKLTRTGPSPCPKSAVRFSNPKAVPRFDGKVTFLGYGQGDALQFVLGIYVSEPARKRALISTPAHVSLDNMRRRHEVIET